MMYAQGLVKAWDRIYSGNVYENFKRVLETSDHGLLISGSSSSGIGGHKSQDNHDTSYNSFDFWIIRTDSNGTLLWEKTFGGNSHEELLHTIETADHGFVFAGTAISDSSGDITEPTRGAGYNDYWMIKTDSLGNKLWDKRFGGDYVDLLSCVIQTSDGGYLLGGTSLSDMSGDKSEDNHNPGFLNYDYWVIKTDANGTKQWDRTIGGDNYDIMQEALELPSGDFLLGGYSRSYTSGDKSEDSRGEADYWIVKISAAGNVIWDRTYGGDNIDWLFGLIQSADGGFMLAGTSGSGDSIGERTVPTRGGWDFWLVKTDANGNKLWDHAYGGPGTEEISTISMTSDSGFLLSGTSYSNAGGEKSEDNLGIEQGWLVKCDSTGNIEWDRTVFTYGHDETGYAIQTYEGCYVAGVYTEADTGGYKSHHNLMASDYWIVKFCYEKPVAALFSSDTSFCDPKCIDFYDISTNAPVSWFWSFPGAIPTASTDQNPTNICYNAPGNYDVILVAINPYGADTFMLPAFITMDMATPPLVTVSGDTLYASPAFSYQWYRDTAAIPGATGSFLYMDVPGSYSLVITDSNGCSASSELFTTGIGKVQGNTAFEVYPNPTDGNFILSAGNLKGQVIDISISNVHGQVIFNKELLVKASGLIPLTFEKQSPGTYFITVTSGSGSHAIKLFVK